MNIFCSPYRHRYEVHVRHHTGETPFKCHICGKGFRDDRKMRLHVARHDGTLPNKCDLCPRSFEGPKALEKHKEAHRLGRFVQPKVIMNADGTMAMALPTETGAGGPGIGTSTIVPTATAATGGTVDSPQLTTPVIGTESQMNLALAGLQPIPPAAAAAHAAAGASNTDTGGGGHSSAGNDDDQATISLSMDDLMQYAQPVPDSVIHEENGLEDKLTAGATTKFVPLNMDEFTGGSGGGAVSSSGSGTTTGSMLLSNKTVVESLGGMSTHGSLGDHVDLHNDSGEFPDLLDSESNLESLSTFAGSGARTKVDEDQESGLTFATLSGVKPVYPDGVSLPNKESQVVVARKSAAVPLSKPATSIVKSGDPSQQQQIAQQTGIIMAETDASGEVPAGLGSVKTEDLVNVLASEAMSQLSKQIKLPAGTCLVPADARCEPTTYTTAEQAGAAGGQLELMQATLQNNQVEGSSTNPMTITIQYKIYPDSQSEPQKVAVQRDLADIISEAPPDTLDGKLAASVATASTIASGAMSTTTPIPSPSVSGSMATTSATTPTPLTGRNATKVKPVGADMDPSDLPAIPVQVSGPDPSKDVRKVISPAGKEFDVPNIVTSGFDLDQLMCTICTKTFKNDKTLMSHMLHHFGVTPKMASCPICGLTLQKKSYARHLRLHGNVVPEVCPYCNKEFREKRSLDKHIKAIHQAERPFACPIPDCNETFRNQVELKNHHNRHIKDYPFECDRCTMTFQKQDSLTTHYRSHTGEKPFICEICDKSFTSEKNKKVHVQRHQGSLPHKCEVCGMTFQSRSHLIKHATSHNRRASTSSTTQATIQMPVASSNKINNFLESFTASLGDDMLGSIDDHVGPDDNSVRLSVDTIPEHIEAAAAEAAFALNQHDLPEELLRTTEVPSSMIMPTTTSVAALGAQVSMHDQGSEILLKCDICHAMLKDKRAYIVHMKKHAGTQSLKCKFCGLILSGQQNFNKHIRTNHNMDPNTVQAIVIEEEFNVADNEDNGSVLSSSESFRGQSGRGSVASSSNFDPAQQSAMGTGSAGVNICPQLLQIYRETLKNWLSG